MNYGEEHFGHLTLGDPVMRKRKLQTIKQLGYLDHGVLMASAYYTFIMPVWLTKRYKIDTYILWINTKCVPKFVFIYNKITFWGIIETGPNKKRCMYVKIVVSVI